jgi:hypothetical protein
MRTIILTIAGVVGVAGVAFVIAPNFFSMSSSYDHYVCTGCGLEKAEYIRKLGPFVFHREVSFEDSAVSRVLKTRDCPHSWLLYRFGFSSSTPGRFASIHADGGCRSLTLPLVLHDDVFAGELAHMDNASKNWGALAAMLNSNSNFDELFGSWLQDPNRGDFHAWAETNGIWTPIDRGHAMDGKLPK